MFPRTLGNNVSRTLGNNEGIRQYKVQIEQGRDQCNICILEKKVSIGVC